MTKPARTDEPKPASDRDTSGKTCPPKQDRSGKGTTGAGNPSPAGASRTGGATGGADPNRETDAPGKTPR